MSAVAFGQVIGCIIGFFLLSIFLRYALLGLNGPKRGQLWVVLLTVVVAVGLSSFGTGTGGFVNRITNPPDMGRVVCYVLAALVVGFFIWRRGKNDPPTPDAPNNESIIGRSVGLVLAVPIILIGLGNIAVHIYALTAGPESNASKAKTRAFMLNGDMGDFWQMIDQRAPGEMDLIIDRIYAHKDDLHTREEMMVFFNKEITDLRLSLSIYGPAMTDAQRIDVLESHFDFLRAFEDRPALCAKAAMNGGTAFSQAKLRSVQGILNNVSVPIIENLLDAKLAALEGAITPTPSTDEDYEIFFSELQDRGMSEDALDVLANGDPTHPDFCPASIAFLEGMIEMQSTAGEAVRFEILQEMLGTS